MIFSEIAIFRRDLEDSLIYWADLISSLPKEQSFIEEFSPMSWADKFRDILNIILIGEKWYNDKIFFMNDMHLNLQNYKNLNDIDAMADILNEHLYCGAWDDAKFWGGVQIIGLASVLTTQDRHKKPQ